MAVKLPLADELAAIFARASELLLTDETVSKALELITAAAGMAVPGAAGAGVTLIDADGRKHTANASNPVVEVADARQYELGQGPCLQAWASGQSLMRREIRAGRSGPALRLSWGCAPQSVHRCSPESPPWAR
jgi:hypothetical protein